MDKDAEFICRYRRLVDTFHLSPEASAKQLAAILKRVCGPPPQTAERYGREER